MIWTKPATALALILLIGGCGGTDADPEGQTSLLASTPMAVTASPSAANNDFAVMSQAMPAIFTALPAPKEIARAMCFQWVGGARQSLVDLYRDSQSGTKDGVRYAFSIQRDRTLAGLWSLDEGSIECDNAREWPVLPLGDMAGVHFRADGSSDRGHYS